MVELKTKEVIKFIKKEEFETELTKEERARLMHEDNFDVQDGGNRQSDYIK